MITECFDQEHKRGVLVDRPDSYRLNRKIIAHLLNVDPKSFDPEDEGWRDLFGQLKLVYR